MTPPSRVLVTGAAGNLGQKLITALCRTSWCEEVVAMDVVDGAASASVRWVVGDLRRPARIWTEAVAGVAAVVHLAAQNPYPDASWADSASSFDMTAHLLQAAIANGVSRFVLASSNHVMGGYKDTETAVTPGALTTVLPPRTGTVWRSGETMMNSTAYAAAKLMGERLCLAHAGAITSVSVRIGWCQPGDNRPDTLSGAGSPKLDGAAAQAPGDLRWFQDMWLSNRDFTAVMLAALTADPAHWPVPGIVVNGVSANRDMPWEVASAGALIGYQPKDDVRAAGPSGGLGGSPRLRQ